MAPQKKFEIFWRLDTGSDKSGGFDRGFQDCGLDRSTALWPKSVRTTPTPLSSAFSDLAAPRGPPQTQRTTQCNTSLGIGFRESSIDNAWVSWAGLWWGGSQIAI